MEEKTEKDKTDKGINKAKERTLVLIKPDAIKKKIENEILKRIVNDTGLSVTCLKSLRLKSETIEKFYSHVKAKTNQKLFNALIDYMSSEDILAVILEGENAVLKVRDICGPTDPSKAKSEKPNSIRALYSNDSLELATKENRAVQNVMHASGSVEEAEKEIALLGL